MFVPFKSLLIILIINVFYVCESSIIKSGCLVSINSHLANPQPLLLKQNNAITTSEAFPLPIDDQGTLSFKAGEKIDIACPSNSVILDGVNTNKIILEAQCKSGITFLINGKNVEFDKITCKTYPFSIARYTKKTCAGKYKEIEVGFNVNKRFIQNVLICFDNVLQNSLYTYADLTATIAGNQIGHPRPRFNQGSFYNVTPRNLNNIYSRTGQRTAINEILGLPKDDTSIVQDNSDYYLSKGHYSAKADFIYGSHQNSTLWYVNVAPQWQTFNGGNWNTMEGDCRRFASDRQLDLKLYTGSHGISTLPDKNGVQQKLYLFEDTKTNRVGIPVPSVYYRVVYDPKNKAGVAFVGLNNPHKKDVQEDVFCEDVCDQIKWVTWNQTNLYLGYSYCCEVNELRKTITTIPSFEVKSLLV